MSRTSVEARPVLKWAGGKTRLLERILPLLPESIETYFEPFVGGGAVFFALAGSGRFRRAVLGDRNPDLIEVYHSIRDSVTSVIHQLEKHSQRNEALSPREREAYYYEVRESSPKGSEARAARLLYLNKTGYNGLYRVNRSGEFNVPYGRYTRPRILDEANLRAASAALQGVELVVSDFHALSTRASPGDAVYFDPPYLPVSRTSSFTAYDCHPFGIDDHRRLAASFSVLAIRGVTAVLSNSDTPVTRDLFGSWELSEVQVGRSINSQKSLRGPVTELLVVNHPRKR